MRKPVLKTYKILKDKACNADIDESWVEWAIEMMQEGYEVESLYQLASISKPYNQFELQDLTKQVLKDLQLDYSNKPKAIYDYTYYLMKSNLNDSENYHNVLEKCINIYYELDMDNEFQDLMLLYWAKNDLLYSDSQHYWEGADKTNIDGIIKEQFEFYIKKFENEK